MTTNQPNQGNNMNTRRLDRETKLAIVQSVDNIMRLLPAFDAAFSVIEEWTGVTPARLVQTMKNASAHADEYGLDKAWVRQAIINECVI